MKRLLLLALLFAATSAAAADIDVVRQNFISYTTAAGVDTSSPRLQNALASLEAQTREYTAPGFYRSDGSWSDINYDETPSGSWSPWDHVRRLAVMAKAFRTPGQAFYRDSTLRAQIESSLIFTNRFYGLTRLPNGNWWFWTIGIPLDLAPTLVLMRGEVSQKTYDDCVAGIYLRIGSSPTSRGIVGPVPTGQNLVWSSYTHLTLGLLRDDAGMLAQVRDAMASVTLTGPGDGIQTDYSFHQHGPQLYTGGYGGSFANDVAKYMLLTRGTTYGLPASSLSSFSNYIADGIAWSLYGNYFDVSVVGREVARVSTTGFNGVAALLQSAMFDSPRQVEIRAAAAKMLQSWTWGLPVELAGLAASVERAGYLPFWPEGHRHYYASDYTVHRRNGWLASIKMFSTRTKSGESTNGENILGSRQSDGRFYLVLDGDEYFGGDVWPAFDWARMPGTTVEQKPDTADASFGFGTRSFAGGTGDAMNGVSAMELAPLNSLVVAKKSWFFFDDAIVFLTNGITSPSGNRIETIVNQWPVASDDPPLVTSSVFGVTRWALLGKVGYYFPAPVALQVKDQTRTGSWAALGGSTDDAPRSARLASLWLDHGTAPANASAEYIVIPNATAETMRAWSSWSPVEILANNADASAARDRRSDARGIVFWKAGVPVDGVSADLPSIVYVKKGAWTLEVYASDPSNGSGNFHVRVPGRYSTREALSTNDWHSTTITIPRNGGRTFHATLTPLTSKRRAAR